MQNFLIFAGTTEGRRLAEKLSDYSVDITVSVATEYGKELLPIGDNINILVNRLYEAEMQKLIFDNKYACVIDATHPYASEVTKNIKISCEKTNTHYVRLLRENEKADDCVFVENTKKAVEFLNTVDGNVLLTTGSKELDIFTNVTDYNKRIFARVLPTCEVVEKCYALGFNAKNLICMQGPFTEEMNVAMLKQVNAKYMVTKESGDIGGFAQKIHSAKQLGIVPIVIGRPIEENGFGFDDVIKLIVDKYSLTQGKKAVANKNMFPLFVDLTNKKIRVFGAGKIALRRIETLLKFEGSIEVISPNACDEIKNYALNNKIKLRIKEYEQGDCNGAYMVLALTDYRSVNQLITRESNSLGIYINVGDCKEDCNFYFPGIVKRDNVVIGVTASGGNHKLAKEVTQNINKNIGQIIP